MQNLVIAPKTSLFSFLEGPLNNQDIIIMILQFLG